MDQGAGVPLERYAQAAIAVGAAVLGLTAYVYVLGGAVMWFRLTAARLPSDEVTSAFQDRQLLATGMKALLFEAVLLAVLSVLALGAWKAARRINDYLWKREEKREKKERRIGEGSAWEAERGKGETLEEDVLLVVLRSLIAAVSTVAVGGVNSVLPAGIELALFIGVLGIGLAIGAVALFRTAPGWVRRQKSKRGVRVALAALRWGMTLAVAVFALFVAAAPLGLTIFVLLVLVQFSEYVVRLRSVAKVAELIVPVLILAAALNVVIVPYLATPPVTFDTASVITVRHGVIPGAFIGKSGEGVYLGTCMREDRTTSKAERIRFVPTDEVKRVELTDKPYSFDYGKRPSLFSLVKHLVTHEPIGDEDALELDLRNDRSVCGDGKGTAAKGPIAARE